MTVSQSPSMPLLESVLHAERARVDANVALLDRAQEITRQQGDAMVELLESAGDSNHLDVYA